MLEGGVGVGRERAGERESEWVRMVVTTRHLLANNPTFGRETPPTTTITTTKNEQTMATMQGLTDEFQTLQKGARFAWQGFGGRGMLADGRVEQT